MRCASGSPRMGRNVPAPTCRVTVVRCTPGRSPAPQQRGGEMQPAGRARPRRPRCGRTRSGSPRRPPPSGRPGARCRAAGPARRPGAALRRTPRPPGRSAASHRPRPLQHDRRASRCRPATSTSPGPGGGRCGPARARCRPARAVQRQPDPRRAAMGAQLRRDHPGVVGHQQVAGDSRPGRSATTCGPARPAPTCSSRAASRGRAGCCAISPGGRSKANGSDGEIGADLDQVAVGVAAIHRLHRPQRARSWAPARLDARCRSDAGGRPRPPDPRR